MTLPRRRSVVLGSLAVGGSGLAACSSPSPDPEPEQGVDVTESSATDAPSPSAVEATGSPVLLAYFSRPGENYYYGDRIDLEVGNTKVLAERIADRTGCDLHEIVAADPYSDDYDATVERNSQEQEGDARPEISGDLPSLDGYDAVILASPIWNVRPPMIMTTFAEALDLTDKLVHPVVTYAVSGLGTADEVYAEACPGATLGQALAVQGEEVADAGPDIDSWLAEAGLIPR